jgi:hypothetical protein
MLAEVVMKPVVVVMGITVEVVSSQGLAAVEILLVGVVS